MGQFEFAGRLLDARPDRVDFRDRPYLPPLRPLPPSYPRQEDVDTFFQEYADACVLNQGSEGACTGFGLAAMINYLYWSEAKKWGQSSPDRVSPRMLYELARLYDEWDGEDYEGSSCRGAMKGWHKHGVCGEKLWPYGKRFRPPEDGWAEDAAERPLGAYYRVDAKSLNDMQAAINECGAVYASSRIHSGWQIASAASLDEAVIPLRTGPFVGGHAFALVGYTRKGFIVQNSWGPGWGYCGFGLLAYGDWVEGGFDAWVASSGAPVAVERSPVAFSAVSLQTRVTPTVPTVTAPNARNAMIAQGSLKVEATSGGQTVVTARSAVAAAVPAAGHAAKRALWDSDTCYRHAVVLGNDGAPLRRLPACQDGDANMVHVLKTAVQKAYAEGHRTLALYLHGGLNDEAAGIARTTVLGPAMLDNGIYPVFVVWRTGIFETIVNIVKEVLPRDQLRAEGVMKEFGRSVLNWLDEQKDRTIELAARVGGGKAVWTEIKENASLSAEPRGGMRRAAAILKELQEECPDLSIHVVAHSAGAILFGHLLRCLGHASGVTIKTTTLFAPAATVDFAVERYGPAFEAGVLPKNSLLVHFLDNKIELRDTVAVYGRSLLYLVARAFEPEHKTPLLGLQFAWKNWWGEAKEDDSFHPSFDPQKKSSPLAKWEAIAAKFAVSTATLSTLQVDTGPELKIDAAHGSFDNDLAVINDTLRRILRKAPPNPVTDLTGF